MSIANKKESASTYQENSKDSFSDSAQVSLGADIISRTVQLDDLSAETNTTTDTDTFLTELVTDAFEGESPDAIFPLSGGITQRKDGRWRTLSGSDVGEHGLVTVGRARIIAGAKIAQLFPDASVVANSYNRFDAEEPSMASISKEELVRRNIPEDQIILEEKSFSTITQYTEMINLAVENDWKNLAVIINDYYVGRATGLYEHLDSIVENDEFQDILAQFKSNGGKVSFIVCDEVMAAMDNHYTEYLNKVKQTEAYKKTVEMEARGLKDLLEGKYRVVLSPEKPRG